jgi:hypothetical protein
MPLIYSLVSREVHVLAEYTVEGTTGNFSTISRVLLKVHAATSNSPSCHPPWLLLRLPLISASVFASPIT